MNAVKEKTSGYFSSGSASAVRSGGTTAAFLCFAVFSFLLGMAASALFDLASNTGAKAVVDRYLSYEIPRDAESILGGFLSVIRTDVTFILLIFLFGLCIFPLIGLLPILFYKTFVWGIAAGISISSGYISPASALPVIMLSTAFILSVSALSISASASFCFSADLRRKGCSPGQILSSGMLKKYVFAAGITVGISAISAGIQLLYYCVF